MLSTDRTVTGQNQYHGVLQQVLQFAEAAVPVTGVLPLDGLLQLPQVRLAVTGVAHELEHRGRRCETENVRKRKRRKKS